MKKYIPYLFGFLLLGALIILLITGAKRKAHKFNPRITLNRKDKIPYGMSVAFTGLGHLFSQATIYTSRAEPGYWDSLSNYESNQAFISINGRFSADEEEMRRLINFAENGNDVFISTTYASAAADKMLGCNSSSYGSLFFGNNDQEEDMKISLVAPPFRKNTTYKYPGTKFNSYFDVIDSTTTEILGYGENGRPNFIHLHAGKGNFYLQMEPLAFSNYFLLHKDNIHYYENALSVISSTVKKIVWDEYYLYKRNQTPKKGWLTVLLGFPALKAALLTAIFTLLLYSLLEMRRKQRYIPFLAKPKNESLDFVKTIGRLYYDKGDHKNLCNKMAAYFLEYVRNRYKLATNTLDEKFIKLLQYKSGADEGSLTKIVSFIKYLDETQFINSSQLTDFHKQLESFYNKS